MKKRFEFDSKIHASKGYFNVVGVVGNMEKEVKAHRQSPYNEDIRENNYTIEILTSEADKIDVSFYPNDGEYRGNIYKNGKIIGDYSCNDSVELENTFSQLKFNW